MCSSCEVLNLNGLNCHEVGCPEAWKDYKRECKWCGQLFTPEEKWDNYCSHSCYTGHNSIACDCEECNG